MLSFSDLKSTYDDFHKPVVQVLVNGKEISADKKGFTISDIYVDLTCGYEASVAEFMIYNTYDELAHEFKFAGIKKYILMAQNHSISVTIDAHEIASAEPKIARIAELWC